MNATQHSLETGTAMVAKAAPPVSVSIASVAGYQVNEILLWATLIYTVLMIGHKLYSIVTDVLERRALCRFREANGERRLGEQDTRRNTTERRKIQSPR
jgi:hypothetical protein